MSIASAFSERVESIAFLPLSNGQSGRTVAIIQHGTYRYSPHASISQKWLVSYFDTNHFSSKKFDE